MNIEQTIEACRIYLNLEIMYQSPENIGKYIIIKREGLIKYKQYAVAIAVLYNNYNNYKKCITTNTTMNGWFDKDRFKPIAETCLEILNNLDPKTGYNIEVWQLQLKEWFKDIIKQ